MSIWIKTNLNPVGNRVRDCAQRAIAAALDVPDDTIAAALGHSGANTTTSIYIERERRKVDEANRRVIDFVLYDKK